MRNRLSGILAVMLCSVLVISAGEQRPSGSANMASELESRIGAVEAGGLSGTYATAAQGTKADVVYTNYANRIQGISATNAETKVLVIATNYASLASVVTATNTLYALPYRTNIVNTTHTNVFSAAGVWISSDPP